MDRQQLIQTLCDLEVPNTIRISPDGERILYATSLSWGHRKGSTAVSTLWLADRNKQDSSFKLTSGTFNDHSPAWNPRGTDIAFISDRGEAGRKWAIYTMQAVETAKAQPVTPETNEKEITSFAFCPDGRRIAFISPDEDTPEQLRKRDCGEDFQVWGETWAYNRLRIVNVASKEIRHFHIDRHVLQFSWKSDGKALAVLSCQIPEFQARFIYGCDISIIDIEQGTTNVVCKIPGPADDIAWANDGKIYFSLGLPTDKLYCGHAAYVVEPASGSSEYRRVGWGESDDVASLHCVRGNIVVQVQHRLKLRLCRIDGAVIHEQAESLEGFDFFSEPSSVDLALAIAKSRVGQPTEIYTLDAGSADMVKVSNHAASVSSFDFGKCVTLRFPSTDSTVELDALYLTPATCAPLDVTAPPMAPAPTVVLAHGGPNLFCTNAFNTYDFMWATYLQGIGYGVLIPVYRGSRGRGETFAAASIDGGGQVDYEDIIAATEYAVQAGLAEKSKLIIAGWSNGGYLALMCSIRNKLHPYGWEFKAAICGAGISDSDSMAQTSDLGSVFQPELNDGRVMWNMDCDDTRNRRRSPLWEFKGAVDRSKRLGRSVIPPMLILHGERDARCHVSQAEGMRRALASQNLPYEYVVYPRQGHFPHEQKCWIDMATRIGRWCDKHITD